MQAGWGQRPTQAMTAGQSEAAYQAEGRPGSMSGEGSFGRHPRLTAWQKTTSQTDRGATAWTASRTGSKPGRRPDRAGGEGRPASVPYWQRVMQTGRGDNGLQSPARRPSRPVEEGSIEQCQDWQRSVPVSTTCIYHHVQRKVSFTIYTRTLNQRKQLVPSSTLSFESQSHARQFAVCLYYIQTCHKMSARFGFQK